MEIAFVLIGVCVLVVLGFLLYFLNTLRTQILQDRASDSQESQTVESHVRGMAESFESLKKDFESRLTRLQSGQDEKLGKFQTTTGKIEVRLQEISSIAEDFSKFQTVLTGVKSRGEWGEVQLMSIVAEYFHPDQYEENWTAPGTKNKVEVAIKLPEGLIPIDSKFPFEDYDNLLKARESKDYTDLKEFNKKVDQATVALGRKFESMGAEIATKYVKPPHTLDFGIMFLPGEGIYAECISNQKTMKSLSEKKIFVSGPSTLSVQFRAFQHGFKTMAMSDHANKISEKLLEVRTEFREVKEWARVLQHHFTNAQTQLKNTSEWITRMDAVLASFQVEEQRTSATPDVSENELNEGEI